MNRRMVLVGIPILVIVVLLMLRGLRAGRVEVDPAPRAVVRKAAAAMPVEAAAPRVSLEKGIPQEDPVKPRSTAVEVLGPTVPFATARAVNSWFDFESAISDLSSGREALGEEMYRREVIRMTVEFLGLAPERVPAFESTLRGVQADLRMLQQEMGRELAAHPVDLSDGQLQRLQTEAEDRLRPKRDAALARFGTFLDENQDRHKEFRAYLDVWVTRCCGLDP